MKGKRHPLPRIAALLLLVLAAGAPAQEKQRTVQDVYAQAVKQYEAGQYGAALQGFQTVLKYQPNFVYARSYAAKCLEAMKQGGAPKQNLDTKLAALTLPSVHFEGADLGLVFEYLTQKSEELSGGKVVANFIYKGTEEDKKNQKVVLSLRNVPFTDVIRYIGQLTNTVFTYEEFAIVATPAGAAPEPKPVKPAKAETPFPKTPQADPFAKPGR
jgi:hypothetical protein